MCEEFKENHSISFGEVLAIKMYSNTLYIIEMSTSLNTSVFLIKDIFHFSQYQEDKT